MSRSHLAMLVFTVIVAGAATIWMAWQMSALGPVWMAAAGPVLLALTLLAHLKARR